MGGVWSFRTFGVLLHEANELLFQEVDRLKALEEGSSSATAEHA